MDLNTYQIDKTISWLMKNASPPVKYLTATNLLKMTPGSAELTALWKNVETCKDAAEIFSKQQEDGSWCSGGSWALKPSYLQKGKPGGYDPESPKYVTAIWILPLLGDMGFTVNDHRVRLACEYILSCKALKECYNIFNNPSTGPGIQQHSLCRFSYHLAALSKAGFAEDERTRRGFKTLLNAQQQDGGWVSPGCRENRQWTRSCPFSSYGAALALYSAKQEEYHGPLIKALEFLAGHMSAKKEEEIQRFFYHGHSTIHELLMFTELKTCVESKPVQVLLEWLMTMYHAEPGCLKYSGKPISRYSLRNDGMDARVAKYRLYHLIENDWLTYYAARILTNWTEL